MPLKVTVFMSERMILPEGIYETIISYFEEFQQFNRFANIQEDGVKVGFTIMEGEFKHKMAWQFFTPKLSPKSKLNRLCSAARRKDFVAAELMNVNTVDDIKAMIYKLPVKIFVKNKISGAGKPYYQINEFMQSNAVYSLPDMELVIKMANDLPKIGKGTTIAANMPQPASQFLGAPPSLTYPQPPAGYVQPQPQQPPAYVPPPQPPPQPVPQVVAPTQPQPVAPTYTPPPPQPQVEPVEADPIDSIPRAQPS